MNVWSGKKRKRKKRMRKEKDYEKRKKEMYQKTNNNRVCLYFSPLVIRAIVHLV